MFSDVNLLNTVNRTPGKRGWIEMIAGCMFSGKTEELIRRVNRAIIAKQNISIFKPTIDTRYHAENVVSHNENLIKSIPVSSAEELFSMVTNTEVVAIDEIQFFNASIVEVCNEMANQGKRVITAGLDMDFEGEPFDNTSRLLTIAEYVTKLQAICVVCGADASFSYRLTKSAKKILVGAMDQYEARCRVCFNK